VSQRRAKDCGEQRGYRCRHQRDLRGDKKRTVSFFKNVVRHAILILSGGLSIITGQDNAGSSFDH
jgi:hypothetical protein